MKKFLPLIAITGICCLFSGCNQNEIALNKDSLKDNVNTFKTCLENYSNLRNENLNATKLNKYILTLVEPIDTNNTDLKAEEIDPEFNMQDKDLKTLEYLDEEPQTAIEDDPINDIDKDENEDINKEPSEDKNDDNLDNSTRNKQVSTLYSLSQDIDDSCEDFCELKEELTNAIIETQNLLTKLQNKEVELSLQEKMFVTEQAMQLKNLGRQLSNITTELSFNLSDLNEFMSTSNKDLDTMSIKYLLVLDNLINGNEMLKTGLSSLNLMRNAFKMNNMQIPPNNTGRIIYGFQQNGQEPVIKDYLINENGKIVENKEDNVSENTSNDEKDTEEKSNTNIDSYANTNLISNIDTYGNNLQNIDTFFNTALLDNEFMYGNGGYGYNGFGMYQNPYMGQYAQYERNNKNAIDNVNNFNNTPHIDNNLNNNQSKKERKKLKITKNIDTYKDENTPNLKSRWENIKQTFNSIFNANVKPKNSNYIKNPVYRESLNIKNDF